MFSSLLLRACRVLGGLLAISIYLYIYIYNRRDGVLFSDPSLLKAPLLCPSAQLRKASRNPERHF